MFGKAFDGRKTSSIWHYSDTDTSDRDSMKFFSVSNIVVDPTAR